MDGLSHEGLYIHLGDWLDINRHDLFVPFLLGLTKETSITSRSHGQETRASTRSLTQAQNCTSEHAPQNLDSPVISYGLSSPSSTFFSPPDATCSVTCKLNLKANKVAGKTMARQAPFSLSPIFDSFQAWDERRGLWSLNTPSYVSANISDDEASGEERQPETSTSRVVATTTSKGKAKSKGKGNSKDLTDDEFNDSGKSSRAPPCLTTASRAPPPIDHDGPPEPVKKKTKRASTAKGSRRAGRLESFKEMPLDLLAEVRRLSPRVLRDRMGRCS